MLGQWLPMHGESVKFFLLGDVQGRESGDAAALSILLNKARLGKDGGLGGKETPLHASERGFLPPEKEHHF